MKVFHASSIVLGAFPALKAFCKILDTMKAMEWSADCLVLGSFFAGSPMMPKAGSYATMLMFSMASMPKGCRRDVHV